MWVSGDADTSPEFTLDRVGRVEYALRALARGQSPEGLGA